MMVTRSTRRLGRSRQDELLDEAARQLNARGVSQTSLADIADGLGISRAAIYYYVDDREDLVFKVYRRSLEVLARHLGESARFGRPALEVIHTFVASTLDAKEPEIAALSEIGLLRAPERETVLALYEGVVARLASVLAAGYAAGEVRVFDFEVAARCIVSMIYWTPLAGRWSSAVAVSRDRAIALTCELISVGVANDRTQSKQAPQLDLSPLFTPAMKSLDQKAMRAGKREAILLAASRLFNVKGVDTTSLDEIAASLGTNKRALYRYVGDKQAIVTACYERAFRIAIFVSENAGNLDVPAAEQFDAQQRAYALVQQNRDICPIRHLSGIEALPASSRASLDSLARQLTDAARQRFLEAQGDGDMRLFDVNELLLVAPGPSTWLAKPLVQSSEERQGQIAVEIADFIRRGLAPV